MAQEITGVSAATAAGMVGIISIANGSGRFLWAWLSDYVGRRWVFLAMFLLQAVLFFLMPGITRFGVFTAIAFVILLCYGRFRTMPAFATDYFAPAMSFDLRLDADRLDPKRACPLLIAHIRETTGHYSEGLHIIAVIMLISAILPFMVHPPACAGRPACPTD